jgi:hypothetical protein
MAALGELYRINDENLALRRSFVQLTDGDVATLRRLAKWGEANAEQISKSFYEHQFTCTGTKAFFEGYAQANGRSMADLRAGLERAQAGYFKEIFAEAKGPARFGAEYFERPASTQQTAASALELSRTADELEQLVGQFNLAE